MTSAPATVITIHAIRGVMLQSVQLGSRSIDEFRGVAREALLEQLLAHASALRGARVLHVNATPYGGGVSELLRSVVPLLNDLGIVADWQVISGDDEFFGVTKKIHNGLQGMPVSLSDADRDVYLETATRNAIALAGQSYDFVFIHDPQPAALRSLSGDGHARWIWRCHIDTSAPHGPIWEFLREYLDGYDAAIFTMDEFLPPGLPIDRVHLIPPAIDPSSPKNFDLDSDIRARVLGWLGIDRRKPIVTQISRFDPWKDPLGVIEAFRMAREEVQDLQLILAGSMALDDPEGWEIYREIAAVSEGDPAISVLTNLTGVGNFEVNALQREATVVVQKSIREGFGLVVSEALWKSTPVVAGRAGGIPLQMADGGGGFLVDSIEQCAQSIARLAGDSDLARELGELGRQRVAEHFLLPRLLLNELSLMLDLAQARPLIRPPAVPGAERDPVCGMAIQLDSSPPSAIHQSRTYVFCSERCRTRFIDQPESFV